MIGALIFLALIISVIVLMVKLGKQRKRIDKLEDALNK
jgi:flagellar biogenesis protein FliO